MTERQISIQDILSQAVITARSSGCEKAWVYAAFTDDVYLRKWNPADPESLDSDSILSREKRLLELRVFWENAEFKVFRGNIGKGFRRRVVENDDAADFYDEEQYLIDYDENKGTQKIHSGKQRKDSYRLTIRNYVSYYDTSGQAYISDYRMVKVERGE